MRTLLTGALALLLAAHAHAQLPGLPTPAPSGTPAPGPAPPVTPPPGPGREAVNAGQDPARSHASALALKAPLGLRWRVRFDTSFRGEPLIAGGRVFVARANDRGGDVDALEASSGRRLWSVRLPDQFPGALAYGAGRVFVTLGDKLTAFDAATGAREWTVPAASGFSSTPVVTDGLVFLQTTALWAFDAATGAVRYEQGLDGTFGDPAVSGDRIFTSGGCTDYALNRLTGVPIWSQNPEACHGGGGGSPVLVGDRVAYPRAATEADQRSAADGQPLTGPAYAVVDGDTGVVYDYDTYSAVDIASGRELWTAPSGRVLGLAGALVAVTDEATSTGRFVALRDLRTGRTRWKGRVNSDADLERGTEGSPIPVAGNGILLLANRRELLALGSGTGVDRPVIARAQPTTLRSGHSITVRGRAGRRLSPLRVAVMAGRRPVARAVTDSFGRFRARLRPRRNVSIRVAAPGFRPSAPVTLYAYPDIHLGFRRDPTSVQGRVRVRAVPGVRLGGRRVAIYFEHRDRLRRIGFPRLRSDRTGTFSFAPLDIERGDSFYYCLVGAPRLGLGPRDSLARRCGAARVRL